MRFLALPLISLLHAAVVTAAPGACNADNCLRAVRATYTQGRVVQGSADCASFLMATSTPPAVTQTSTATTTLSFTASTTATLTETASTVSTVTAMGTTVTVYSISGSGVVTKREAAQTAGIERRAVLSNMAIPAPPAGVTARAEVGKRQQTVLPFQIPAYASACSGAVRYSSACSCVGAQATTITVAAPTTVVTVTVTASSTQTVQTSTTVTTTAVSTTTTTTYPTSTVAVCLPPSYGLLYEGGYIAPGPGQTGVNVGSAVQSGISSAQGCCAACFQTTGCYVYYLDQANNNFCTLLFTTAGTSPTQNAQCPNGQISAYSKTDYGYIGFGACTLYQGPPS